MASKNSIDRLYDKYFGNGNYLSKEEQHRRAIVEAETELQARTQDRKEKHQQYNEYINKDPAELDFDTYNAKEAAETEKSLR